MFPKSLNYFFVFILLGGAFLNAEVRHRQALSLESDDPIVYDDGNTTITATKNASLRGPQFLVLADQICWNRKTGETSATGSVSLTKKDTRILADEIYFSTTTGDFTAINAIGGSPPQYFAAENIERNSTIESYKNVRLFMAEPGAMTPNLAANRYSFDRNTSVIASSPLQVRVGHILVGVLPGFSGQKKNHLDGISSILKVGKDSNLGWYGETSLEYNLDSLTTAAKFTYFEKRGMLISPAFGLSSKFDDGYFLGQLEGGWINDRADNLGLDSRNLSLERERGYSHFSSTARLKDRWRTATLLEWESDSEFIRDFRRNYFYRNQWNQGHNELSFEGDAYTFSILTRWQANKHESIVEHLPLINLDHGPSKIDSLNLYHSSTLNYANLVRKNHFGSTDRSVHRLNIGYKMEKPLPLATGINLNPSIAWMHQDYQVSNESRHRSFAEYGLDLHAHMHQVLPFSNETWEIQKLLHLINVSIGFRNTELISGSKIDNLPEIHPVVEDLNLAPLDLLDYRNSEVDRERNLIRLGWENIILGNWNGKSRSLFSMRTYYDFLRGQEGELDDEDFLYSDISIHPIFWLSLNMRHKLDPKSGTNYRRSYGLELKDGRFQAFSVNYLNYLDFNEYIHLSGWNRLNEKLLLSVNALHDLDHGFLAFWMGSLQYRTQNSWIYDFSLSQRKGTRKENNTEWSAGMSLEVFENSSQ